MIEAALDTSYGISLALADDGEVFFSDDAPFERRASEAVLAPWIEDCFHRSGVALGSVSRWTVGLGPGSFTGLRCGIAFVRGVCLQTAAICRGLPSSLAVARQTVATFPEAGRVAVVNDARRGMLILSRYAHETATGRLSPIGEAEVVAPDDVLGELGHGTFLGSVHQKEIETLLPDGVVGRMVFHPRVEAAHLLAPEGWDWPAFDDLEASLAPIYVRPAVFVKPLGATCGKPVSHASSAKTKGDMIQ